MGGIAVVVPSFGVRSTIMEVLAGIGPEVDRIYVVDDRCYERTADLVESECHDPRVTVLRRLENGGVGAATATGYEAALRDGLDVIVKLDGDGQMDAGRIPALVAPILKGEADYSKGNRFFDLDTLREMPLLRRVGNLGLSFMAKASTGLWHTFDPTNGFTAIHARILRHIPLGKLETRYFFETDMLFRLGLLGAHVVDVPMAARYRGERSHLSPWASLPEFLWKHLRTLGKRLLYQYYLRDFSPASFELATGLTLLAFGSVFGGVQWYRSFAQGTLASAGTVMVAALPIIIGSIMMVGFIGHDIARRTSQAIWPRLEAS